MLSSIYLIDTHAHLDAEVFEKDRVEVISRASTAGVDRIITIGAGDGVESAKRAVAIAGAFDTIWATVGVHPHDASIPVDISTIEKLSIQHKVVAIGETGLDYFKCFAEKIDQERWFREQISLALKVHKPLVIHNRSASEDCLRILTEMEASKVGGVFHCFGETAAFAEKLLNINFRVSFPGILTFKKSEQLRNEASAIPLDQILLETDSPYLAPEPYRGKRCESSYMVETAKILAEIKGITLDKVADITTRNALNLFKLS